MDTDQYANDLGDIAAALRARSDCAGKVGVMGFCLGGKFAYLSAVRHPIDAAVTYYGVEIDQYLDEADRLKCPILNPGSNSAPTSLSIVSSAMSCTANAVSKSQEMRVMTLVPATASTAAACRPGKGLNVTSSTNSKTPAITTSARRSPSARVR